MILDKKLLSAESSFQRRTQQLTEKECKKALGTSQHPLQEARNAKSREKQLASSYQ